MDNPKLSDYLGNLLYQLDKSGTLLFKQVFWPDAIPDDEMPLD